MKKPHECYSEFVQRVRMHLAAQRGRASALARYLSVPRQKINIWFGPAHQLALCPGWVAIATIEWLTHQTTPQTRDEWRQHADSQMRAAMERSAA